MLTYAAATKVLRETQLPERVHWIDAEVLLLVDPAPWPGPGIQALAWLCCVTEPTGPQGRGARLFVHPVSLGGPNVETVAALRAHVDAEVQAFQVALEDGTATEMEDGAELPVARRHGPRFVERPSTEKKSRDLLGEALRSLDDQEDEP